MERKSQFHNKFGSYPVEYNNKVQGIVKKSMIFVINCRKKILLFYSSEGKHQHFTHNARQTLTKGCERTGPRPHSHWQVGEEVVAMASPGSSFTEAGLMPKRKAQQRASNQHFSHSNCRQIIKLGWRTEVSTEEASSIGASSSHSGLECPKRIDKMIAVSFVKRKG